MCVASTVEDVGIFSYGDPGEMWWVVLMIPGYVSSATISANSHLSLTVAITVLSV